MCSSVTIERRDAVRVAADRTPWRSLALMRPGLEIALINLSAGGALVESSGRMSPGVRTELQLTGSSRRFVRGRIDRCYVVVVDPLRYQGVVVFDRPLDW